MSPSAAELRSAPVGAREHLLARFAEDPDDLVAGVATPSGAEFLTWLTAHLQRSLDVDYALVAELIGEDMDRVRAVAVATREGPGVPFEYDLRGTPCANVVGKTPCHISSGVARTFPDAAMLAEMGVESYLGIPLLDGAERPLGLIVLLARHAMKDDRARLAQEIMLLFRRRAEAVLDRRKAMRVLQQIAHSVATSPESDPLHALVLQLAETLQVKCAFVSSPVDLDRLRLQTRGCCVDGRIVDDLQYEAEGTPCEAVSADSVTVIPEGVRARYPDDPFLAEVEAEAYVAVGFEAVDGKLLGHLGILHDRPLTPDIGANPVLRLYAERAAVELRRRAQEEHRLALERQVLQLQKSDSLGVLAGGIAHDFNNLLTAILGNLELARMELPAGSAEHEYLDEAVRASERAAGLCSQLLAYACKGELKSDTLVLNDLVRDMAGLLEMTVSGRCRLRFELGAELPTIEADGSQLQQVIMNLTSNGSDAIGDAPGEITVRTGHRRCERETLERMWFGGDREPGEYVFLSVRDNGVGMDQATRLSMFDPFFTTKEVGHGLGLAALSGIMRSLGGAVDVESEAGVGTEVTLYFPARGAGPARNARVRDSGADAVGGTILLVDDEPGVRKVGQALLERAGLRVLTAGSGADAIQIFARCAAEIDGVVLDLTMPEMDGAQTLAHLREIRPDVRVVVASGYAETEVLDRMGGSEVAGVIHKPYGKNALADVVLGVLRGRA